ncbi:uncharacterized protein LOC116170172 [Photinus pyralis]|uniref:uncharacterized protein LOC116170172 n=1 Tax=Photinus pyralis TaxID=7054 RepID=UPI001266F77E|nr:uncharacterized protein LOC116170172 [Photinus pyralis]
MKLVFVFACFAIACNGFVLQARRDYHKQRRGDVRSNTNFEYIINMLNETIAQLKHYDPLDVESRTFKIASYDLTFRNVHLEGFSGIKHDISSVVNGESGTLQIKLNLPGASGSTKSWTLNAPLIFGEGDASFSVQNAKLSISLPYSKTGGFGKAKVHTSMGKAKVSLTGVNNDEILSKKITNFMNFLLNDGFNHSLFQDILGKLVDQFLSKFQEFINSM